MHTKFWSKSLKGRVHLEDLNIDGKIVLAWILEKWDRKVWIICIWLRQKTRGRLL
jgi:hypothetical protein